MAISHPKSYKKIAKEIATPWQSLGGNYILVAPPLTDPDYVFKLLCEVAFLEDCGLDYEKLAIASLPPASYRTSADFVQRVIEMWDVEINNDEDQIDELEPMEDALKVLEEQGRTPIILLPQFHKTIERLSWTLGAQLRMLEANYGLCTVVELPVPLSRLRDRWEMIEDKETFLCSDFGQGHSVMLLPGYQRIEVEELAQAAKLPKDYMEIILSWSGGMPALVRWLMMEAVRAKSSYELEILAKKGSVEQCQRFLSWLDAPGDVDYFKSRVAALWKNSANEEQRVVVRAHDWKDILIDRNGRLYSAAIGFACANSIEGNYNQSLASISTAVMQGNKDNVNALVKGLSEAYCNEERLKHILVLISVWRLAIELSPDWGSIEKASKKAEKQLGSDNSISAKKVASTLKCWQNFAKDIKYFNRLVDRNKEQGWKLSDSLSGRDKGSSLAAVQLVLYRLYIAEKIQDRNAALKSVLEIPEQILQIYCGRKLKIPVWKAPEFPDDVIEEVRILWKRGKYQTPAKGVRLGFSDLLYLGWIMMSRFDEEDRLFQEFSDIKYWELTYEMRNQASHSITFESSTKWEEIYSNCLALTNRLAKSLTGKTSTEALLKLDENIASLAKL